MAILALVFGFIVAPVGIALGVVARKQIARSGEEGRGLATAGIVIGSVFTALSAVLIVVMVTLQSEIATSRTPASSPAVAAGPRPVVPPPSPLPTAAPPDELDRSQIDSVFTRYMNGLSGHDMTGLRAATCPRLRNTLVGFYLHNYQIGQWSMLPYTVTPGVDSLTVEAQMTQVDDNGNSAGQVTYSWNVDREADGKYYVCGWYG